MTRREFYKECWKRSTSGAFGWAEKVEFLLTLIVGCLGSIFAESARLKILTWAIPVAVFVATFAVAWTLAPYWMCQEVGAKLRRVPLVEIRFKLRQLIRDGESFLLELENEKYQQKHIVDQKKALLEGIAQSIDQWTESAHVTLSGTEYQNGFSVGYALKNLDREPLVEDITHHVRRCVDYLSRVAREAG